MNSIIYRGKSPPKDANSHSRSPSHPLGKDLHCLIKAELRFVVRNASPLAGPLNTAAPVFDTGRASSDIASIASKTDIRLEKV